MSGGSVQTGTQTTTQAPPSYMYPYIGTGLSQAGDLLQTGGSQYYPGQPVAGFNSDQQKAMQAQFKAGMNGSPALTAAQGFDQTLLNSGGGPNPYEDAMFNRAAGQTQNQLTGEFAGMGRNASASEALRTEQLNNLATSMYGGEYQNNIQNALAAGNQAQSLYDTRLQGLGTAEGVGQQVQDQSQKLIDASQAAYNYNQNLPWTNARQYEGLLSGLQPGQSNNSPIYTNPTANAMGLASMIASIFSSGGGA